MIFRFRSYLVIFRRNSGQEKAATSTEKKSIDLVTFLLDLQEMKNSSQIIYLSSASKVGSVNYESTSRRQLVIIILGADFS